MDAALVRDGLLAVASQEITYHRGSLQTTLRAIPTRSRRQWDQEDDVQVLVEWRDWLLPAQMLVLDGQPTLPQEGDELVQTLGSTQWRWRVAAPPGDAAWNWTDGTHTLLRVHTLRVRE